MRGRAAERVREAVRAVDGDLARAALELLEDVRAGADGQRVRAADVLRRDRERPPRRRTGRTASGWRPSARPPRKRALRASPSRKTVTLAGRDRDDDAPLGGRADRLVGEDPARVAARPPGQPDVHPAVAVLALAQAHARAAPCARWSAAAGPDGLDDARVRARPRSRATWSCSRITSGWRRRPRCGALACAGAARTATAAATSSGEPASRDEGAAAPHPVNCEGPAAGGSTASAQAR